MTIHNTQYTIHNTQYDRIGNGEWGMTGWGMGAPALDLYEQKNETIGQILPGCIWKYLVSSGFVSVGRHRIGQILHTTMLHTS